MILMPELSVSNRFNETKIKEYISALAKNFEAELASIHKEMDTVINYGSPFYISRVLGCDSLITVPEALASRIVIAKDRVERELSRHYWETLAEQTVDYLYPGYIALNKPKSFFMRGNGSMSPPDVARFLVFNEKRALDFFERYIVQPFSVEEAKTIIKATVVSGINVQDGCMVITHGGKRPLGFDDFVSTREFVLAVMFLQYGNREGWLAKARSMRMALTNQDIDRQFRLTKTVENHHPDSFGASLSLELLDVIKAVVPDLQLIGRIEEYDY